MNMHQSRRRKPGMLTRMPSGVWLLNALYVTTDEAPHHAFPSRDIHGVAHLVRQEGVVLKGVFRYDKAAGEHPAKIAEAIASLARELHCPFIFVQWNLDLPFGLCMRLRALGLVLITADERAADPREAQNLSLLAKYDACISYYHKVDADLRGLGIIPISYAISLNYCAEFIPLPPDAARPVDVMYIGAAAGQPQTAPRIPLLIRLKRSGIAVACWGRGFQACPDLYGKDLAGLPHDPRTGFVESVFAYYQKAKIGLNFDYFHKDRTFKIVLAGAMLLCPDTPQIREYFKPGKEIAVFSCLEEMEDLCRHYLANAGERLAVARRGHEKAMARFRPDKVFTGAFRRFIREAAAIGPDENSGRILRSTAVAMLAGGLDAASALELLREMSGSSGAGLKEQGRALLKAYAALPAAYQLSAGTRAEKLIIDAVRNGEHALAAMLIPLALGVLYFNSRLEILLAAVTACRALGLDCRDLEAEFQASLGQIERLCPQGGLSGEPFFDSLRLKRTLRQRLEGAKTLAIFGAGGNGRAWKRWISEHLADTPVFFVDNDPSKQGTMLDGAPVSARRDLPAMKPALILVASTWMNTIAAELTAMGYLIGTDYICAPCFPAALELNEREYFS